MLATVGTTVGVFAGAGTPVVVRANDSPQPKYGLSKGRLLPCEKKSVCVSTSSINSVEQYARPWTFEGDADEAWAQLKEVLMREGSLLKVGEVNDEKKYIRMEGKSAVPPTSTDDVEFLMANPKERLITLRTNSRDVLMAGPQIVGDGGAQKNRLDSIKRRLGAGWGEMGIEDDEEMAYLEKMSQTNEISRNFGFGRNAASEINFLDNSVPKE